MSDVEFKELQDECDNDIKNIWNERYGSNKKNKKNLKTFGRIKTVVDKGFKDLNINIHSLNPRRKKTSFWLMLILGGCCLFWMIAFCILFIIVASEAGWISPVPPPSNFTQS
jgi:hypothetical protein